MYIIIWEYLVKAQYVTEFEKFYSPDGEWAKLFRTSQGYLGTELLFDSKQLRRYITIDRWVSSEEHETFLIRWQKEYQTLDSECEAFMEQESMLGRWKSVDHELR